MTKVISAIGDKLLARFVPRVGAKADCGEYYEFCHCVMNDSYWRFCCRTGGCNLCQPWYPCD